MPFLTLLPAACLPPPCLSPHTTTCPLLLPASCLPACLPPALPPAACLPPLPAFSFLLLFPWAAHAGSDDAGLTVDGVRIRLSDRRVGQSFLGPSWLSGSAPSAIQPALDAAHRFSDAGRHVEASAGRFVSFGAARSKQFGPAVPHQAGAGARSAFQSLQAVSKSYQTPPQHAATAAPEMPPQRRVARP